MPGVLIPAEETSGVGDMAREWFALVLQQLIDQFTVVLIQS